MTLRLIDTFSGIGGFSYAAEKLVGGFRTVSFVECEPYCQKVLKKHWPNVPIYEDIKSYRPEPYSAEVICGGFPCQDISQAGLQAGITKETRSGLFFQLMRIICLVRPKFIVMENVAAILNNGLGIVLGELASAGYDCEWCCIPASAVGACHFRDRWWLVGKLADTNNYGSSSSEKSRSIKETNGRSKEGKNQTCKPQRSSQPTNSTTIQKAKESSNTDGTRFQRFRREHELQKSSPERTFTWRNSGITLRQDWERFLSKPTLCRGDDGIPSWIHRNPRIKSLGNSVVPQVAAIPLQRVKDLSML